MNRKLKTPIMAILTTFLLLFTIITSIVPAIPPIPQRTLVVDINGNGDFISIKDAVNNALPTDIIKVTGGVYQENNIEINKKISVIGESPNAVIIDCEGENGFAISSKYVDLSNIQLINTKEYAIYITPGSSGCTISNCIITTQKLGIGIWIRASSVRVSNCTIKDYNNAATGIKIREHDHIISDCTFQGLDVGILILLNAYNNVIQNCNFVNNENAIDIRIRSYKNSIINCNIYSNGKGINIWQDSNNNLIHHNNFWKNDIDAVDESNNSWDDGEIGNYWSDYTGVDNNGNGIGDTAYHISPGNTDRYPLMDMILPNEISAPTNIKLVSTSGDNTPSFTWNPSTYSRSVAGYAIRIDNNPQIYIGDTTSWTSDDTLLDGVHTFYVKGLGSDNTTSNYASLIFSINTQFIDSDNDGWSDKEENNYGTDPSNSDNYPLDTDGDHIPDSVDIDDDNDGYTDEIEQSYGTDAKNEHKHPIDTDDDFVPDEDSPDEKYMGDVDDDDDGLIDTIELKLESVPVNGSDVKKFYIGGTAYYLVDVSQNRIFDILYNPLADITTAVEYRDGNYLINENGDGAWDYIYNVENGKISRYGENILLSPSFWIYLILGMFIILTLIALYYIGRKWIKDRIPRISKRVVKELPVKRSVKVYTREPGTIEMIGQTRMLLQNIQEDVSVYMDQLHQIEEQIAKASVKELAIVSKEMVSTKATNIRNRWFIKKEQGKQEQIKPSTGNIEEMVDEALAQWGKKEKNGEGK